MIPGTMRLGWPLALLSVTGVALVLWRTAAAIPKPVAGAEPVAQQPPVVESADFHVEREHAPDPVADEPAPDGTDARETASPQTVALVPGFRLHLIDRLERAFERAATGAPASRRTVDHVAGDARFNPEGKQLSPAQRAELEALLAAQNAVLEPLQREQQAATRVAALAAVANGSLLVREYERIVSSDPRVFGPQLREQEAQVRRDAAELMQTLGKRFAAMPEDWSYTACSTAEPDGVPRQTIVYYSAADAPQLFDCRRRVRAVERAHEQQWTAFFTALH